MQPTFLYFRQSQFVKESDQVVKSREKFRLETKWTGTFEKKRHFKEEKTFFKLTEMKEEMDDKQNFYAKVAVLEFFQNFFQTY